ncbi:hypothetical protein WPS_09480 [Vulcanimicrobium alpinum]|uniref:Uncharacterized protein n=1 Tax=Vulcanimicrobium alpinum TaxID=3016050 RepID=A0AAN1XUB4_UNVUL|nr:hypothetical protein WPS_09480 [Vulcanimicrobium alpinum]
MLWFIVPTRFVPAETWAEAASGTAASANAVRRVGMRFMIAKMLLSISEGPTEPLPRLAVLPTPVENARSDGNLTRRR